MSSHSEELSRWRERHQPWYATHITGTTVSGRYISFLDSYLRYLFAITSAGIASQEQLSTYFTDETKRSEDHIPSYHPEHRSLSESLDDTLETGFSEILWARELQSLPYDPVLEKRGERTDVRALETKEKCIQAYLEQSYEEALDAMLSYTKQFRPDFIIHHTIANILLFHRDDPDKAVYHYQKAAEYSRTENPDYSAFSYLHLAFIFDILQDYRRAYEYATLAAEISPGLKTAQFERARYACRLERISQSQGILEKEIINTDNLFYLIRADTEQDFVPVHDRIVKTCGEILENISEEVHKKKQDLEGLLAKKTVKHLDPTQKYQFYKEKRMDPAKVSMIDISYGMLIEPEMIITQSLDDCIAKAHDINGQNTIYGAKTALIHHERAILAIQTGITGMIDAKTGRISSDMDRMRDTLSKTEEEIAEAYISDLKGRFYPGISRLFTVASIMILFILFIYLVHTWLAMLFPVLSDSPVSILNEGITERNLLSYIVSAIFGFIPALVLGKILGKLTGFLFQNIFLGLFAHGKGMFIRRREKMRRIEVNNKIQELSLRLQQYERIKEGITTLSSIPDLKCTMIE